MSAVERAAFARRAFLALLIFCLAIATTGCGLYRGEPDPQSPLIAYQSDDGKPAILLIRACEPNTGIPGAKPAVLQTVKLSKDTDPRTKPFMSLSAMNEQVLPGIGITIDFMSRTVNGHPILEITKTDPLELPDQVFIVVNLTKGKK